MTNKVSSGKKISAVFAGGATAGDPDVIGQIPGVHEITVSAGGTGVLDTEGVFNLSAMGHDGSNNAAITAGAKVYYKSDATPKINVNTAGVFFGYALDPVDSGATTTIRVRLI